MISEPQLVEAFRALETRQAGLAGDATATAQQAHDVILGRIAASTAAPDVDEFRFSMPDELAEFLFCALLKRYGLTGYRYKRQRKLTVMVRASKRLLDETLQPIFDAALQSLREVQVELTRNFLAAAVSAGPYTMRIYPEHDHSSGRLCERCASLAAARADGAGQGA